MASYGFHPEALAEYAEATEYYLTTASPLVAQGFVAEIEAGIRQILTSPGTWRIVEEPGVRRYLVKRYPYGLYYRWDSAQNRVTIYAVMHLSRKPGYWRQRLD